jgi:hypothetical protein
MVASWHTRLSTATTWTSTLAAMDNSVGETVSIDRGKVDDNRDKGCSAGLHCGALDYVRDYGSEDSGDHIMIVKVNPMDAVSVPHDCQHQKLRVCQYQVVAEMEWSDQLRKPSLLC